MDMTGPTVSPEVREVGKRPFGVYATVLLFLLFIAAAALDIVRLRVGFPSRLLQRIAEVLNESASLSMLPPLFVSDEFVLILINIGIIVVLVATLVGLWFRVRQAWVAALLLVGVGLVYNIWSYLEGTPLYLSMLIHVVAVFYLNERSVRMVFERPPAADPTPTGGVWP